MAFVIKKKKRKRRLDREEGVLFFNMRMGEGERVVAVGW